MPRTPDVRRKRLTAADRRRLRSAERRKLIEDINRIWRDHDPESLIGLPDHPVRIDRGDTRGQSPPRLRPSTAAER